MDNNLCADLYRNIKKQRIRLGMTQTELAEKVGYSDKSMIAKIESGKIDIPVSKVITFAEALHLSPFNLMGWKVPNEDHFDKEISVGKRIKELRERQCLSQVDLADKISVSKQTLYKYENGIVTNIPADKIERLAIVLNTSPGNLMGWNNSNDSAKETTCTNMETPINSQELSDRPEIRILFSASKDVKAEDLCKAAEYLEFLKWREKRAD